MRVGVTWDAIGKYPREIELPVDRWSSQIFTGKDFGENKDGLKFLVSGGEVRPKNMAIKIWKRVE